MILLLLSTLALAEPEDAAPACDFTLIDVIPAAGSTGVPIDTVLRVQGQGQRCDSSPVTLSLIADGGEPQAFTTGDEDWPWHVYADADLAPDTAYEATFSHPEIEDLLVAFTTATGVAGPPQPPQLTLLDLTATPRDSTASSDFIMTGTARAVLADTSGASTAVFSALGVELAERSGPGGIIEATVRWTQADPTRGCVQAVTVSGSLERSAATEACRDVDEVLEPIEVVSGCACASTAGPQAAWLALLVLPALLRRRRG
jgi:MYXO-CTERM domain-containing protein